MIKRAANATGVVVGIVAATMLILEWRIASEPKNERLALKVAALPSPEFVFDPPDVVRGVLVPGRRIEGATKIRNQTGRAMRVSFRASPSEPDVGETVRLAIAHRDGSVFSGDLADLKQWSRKHLTVTAGGVATIRMRSWLRASPDGIFQGLGQAVTISLEVRGVPYGPT